MGDLRVTVGSAKDSAGLPYMEDELQVVEQYGGADTFAAIYDGHGTDRFAQHARDNVHGLVLEELEKDREDVLGAIFRAFQKEDEKTLPLTGKGIEGGCTATVIIIRGQKLFVGNVGDSRAVLVRQSGSERITVDHNPSVDSERERVTQAGGLIFSGRVQGVINITRSLADHLFKFPFNKIVCDGDERITADFVSAKPYLASMEVVRGDTEAVVVASDGVWATISDAQIGRMISEQRQQGKTAAECARYIVETAESNFTRMNRDNLSCVVLYFDWSDAEEADSTAGDAARESVDEAVGEAQGAAGDGQEAHDDRLGSDAACE